MFASINFQTGAQHNFFSSIFFCNFVFFDFLVFLYCLASSIKEDISMLFPIVSPKRGIKRKLQEQNFAQNTLAGFGEVALTLCHYQIKDKLVFLFLAFDILS